MTELLLAWHRLSSMTGPAVHALIRLRETIFVVEQRCAYLEADGLDEVAWHLTAHRGTELVGCLRMIPPGGAGDSPVIGRVATRADVRGQGIGHALMREAVKHAADDWPQRPVALSAQVAVQSFYEALGFVAEGASYLEDDIPHIAMRRLAS